ncbi:alpha/beta fold hydrolase [Catenulispora pinisilvae]|uniref:alpha/beta fold hydrolase n=1 Tax=Catenulispora pinisilvae TaxID=2705253 RepID=UPI001890D9F1|nr:alpha/beta hydrolase [Catenulispora pinisilvae]
MEQHIPDRSWHAEEQYVELGDARVHVVRNGAPDAPVLLLVHGLGASTAWWNPVVPCLADAYRVVRIDLLGHGRSTDPKSGDAAYSIAGQAERIGAVLDQLDMNGVLTAVGHSTGGSVVAELARQRPDAVSALALIGTGPYPEADTSDSPLSRLLFARVPGAFLWRTFNTAIVRKSLSTAFAKPAAPLPDELVAGTRGMTHHALAATARGSLAYIRERTMPDRLTELGKPLLVVFGAQDARWRSAAAEDYRVVPGARVVVLPGIGHTPMYDDPQTTCDLLLEFAGTAVQAR